MTIADRAALLGYRLRPLEPVTLVATVVAALAAGVAMIPGGPPEGPGLLTTGDVTKTLTMVALGLALTVGFVGGRDVDVAEGLLSSMPRPYRRALALRVVLWSIVLFAVVSFLGARGVHALDAPDGVLRAQALVQVLFAGSVTLVLSRTMGSLAGGGAALALVVTLAGMPFLYEGFPVEVLAEPGSAGWTTTAPRLELLSVALLAAAYRGARP